MSSCPLFSGFRTTLTIDGPRSISTIFPSITGWDKSPGTVYVPLYFSGELPALDSNQNYSVIATVYPSETPLNQIDPNSQLCCTLYLLLRNRVYYFIDAVANGGNFTGGIIREGLTYKLKTAQELSSAAPVLLEPGVFYLSTNFETDGIEHRVRYTIF